MGGLFSAGENQDSVSKEGNSRYDNQVKDDVKKEWKKEQMELKKRLVLEDADNVQAMYQAVEGGEPGDQQFYVGGVDISFVQDAKEEEPDACAALVVVSFPQLQVVYEECRMVRLTAPYIPGFLAFREAAFICDLIKTLQETKPELMPHVVIVDGNGTLHPRECGLACHLGVVLDMPFMGAGKTLINVQGPDDMAYDKEDHRNKVDTLQKSGDTFPILNADGVVVGKALRSTDSAKNPIFVSPGHKISLETSVWLAHKCCKFRVPEPVRIADISSREYIKKMTQKNS